MLDFILGMRSPLEWKNTHDDILILLTPICVCVCVCVCVLGGGGGNGRRGGWGYTDTKFGILSSLQPPNIERNSDWVFSISRCLVIKPFINKNCHNFRTGYDTDMKLGALSKLEQRNAMIL